MFLDNAGMGLHQVVEVRGDGLEILVGEAGCRTILIERSFVVIAHRIYVGGEILGSKRLSNRGR